MPVDNCTGRRYLVSGRVQGVGFRPAVWRLAQNLGLAGTVSNNGSGVCIEAWGTEAQLDLFTQQLARQCPSLARIHSISEHALTGPPASTFRIITSEKTPVATGILPDQGLCPACHAEIRDPYSPRHGYAFASCTVCGPRYSVTRALPWDRVTTSLASFPLCPCCQSQYDDPADRRFHAQTMACARCGPRLWLENRHGMPLASQHEAIIEAAAALRQGMIVAIKGIGGFHLACSADNDTAITRLRQSKRRPHKPLALMASDLGMINQHARISGRAKALLLSPESPIVLLPARTSGQRSLLVAPGMDSLGFMLPYSPLHSLLLQQLEQPLVMTSANTGGGQLCYQNRSARKLAAEMADLLLLHDRDILQPADDSVIALTQDDKPLVLRMARGYAPTCLPLPPGFNPPVILAMGSQLKNTFCLVHQGRIEVSPQTGDLSQAEVCRHYLHSVDNILQFYGIKPSILAIDRHPDYHASREGRRLAAEHGAELIQVQHHHAHVAACMAEYGLPLEHSTVLGVVMDGMGAGDDGQAIWGGEFLRADYRHAERIGSIAAVPLPGGERAMQEPWRNTWAHLHTSGQWQQLSARHARLPLIQQLQTRPLAQLTRMLQGQINSPAASSCGRLFDAVAAALGICFASISFEGQAAMQLQALAQSCVTHQPNRPYPYRWMKDENGLLRIDWQPFWLALLEDLASATEPAEIAYRFHLTLATSLASTCLKLSLQASEKIILSGGVFQNTLLLELTRQHLVQHGRQVLIARNMPLNDGGLSLGQAMIAAARAT